MSGPQREDAPRPGARVSVALVHHPARGRNDEITSTAVMPLSVHDLARVGRTYGVVALYVVTPLATQKALVSRIGKHWAEGFGAEYSPTRTEALELVRVVDCLNDAMSEMTVRGAKPVLVATGATGYGRNIGYTELRRDIFRGERDFLLLFGTGNGLARETIDECEYVLDPLPGVGGFNHLPVREAAAIILDRLLATADA